MTIPSESQPSVAIVIPARLQSTRLPRKLLLKETGRALIEHTYFAAKQSRLAQEVIVAVDDQELFDCVSSFGGKAVLTRVEHTSGSSRVAEVAELMDGFDLLVNVQGDEPELSGEAIDAAISCLANNSKAVMATLACPIRDEKQLQDPAVVKVVFDAYGNALYFSRSPIPHARDWSVELLKETPAVFYQHIGLYVYRTQFLKQFSGLPASRREQVESLEQLRVLDAGLKIAVEVVEHYATGIDTPEDYRAFVNRMKIC